MVRYLDEVLLEWVDLGAPAPNGDATTAAAMSPEMISLDDVQRALAHVAASANHSIGALLITTRERPAKLIVNLNMRFAKAHRPQERRRLLHVICFFLRLMQEKLASSRPAIFRGMPSRYDLL